MNGKTNELNLMNKHFWANPNRKLVTCKREIRLLFCALCCLKIRVRIAGSLLN